MQPRQRQKSSDIDPLFKSEKGNIAFYAQKDGRIRLVYARWESEKVVPPGGTLELKLGAQGGEARIPEGKPPCSRI